MKLRTLDVAFEVNQDLISEDSDKGIVRGFASTESLNSYGFKVKSGAFDKSIARRTLRGGKGVKFLLDHDSRTLAGVINKLEKQQGGLFIDAQFNLESQKARERFSFTKMNVGLSFSVGFIVIESVFETIDGQQIESITEADLIEVSSVTFPSDEDAVTTEVLSAQTYLTLNGLEKALVKDGLVPSRSAADKAVDALRDGFAAFAKELSRHGLAKDWETVVEFADAAAPYVQLFQGKASLFDAEPKPSASVSPQEKAVLEGILSKLSAVANGANR
jgi:HK97 family phage prohead protease